jgi:hypothetical protein
VTLKVTGVPAGALSAWVPAACSGTTCTITLSSDQTVSYVATGNNIVFVTSTRTSGAIGGVSAATAICTQTAAAQTLPGTFVPWLGDGTANPVTALGSARGWIRVDGLPVADTLGVSGGTTGLLGGQIYYPPAVTELGQIAPPSTYAWTGNGSTGSCSGWTSTTPSDGLFGNAFGAGGVWSDEGGTLCTAQESIYCFGKDLATPLTLAPQPGRHAFVSTGTFTPSTGIATADQLCQTEARASGLQNSANFLAYLFQVGSSADARFNQSGASWVRPDGTPIHNAAYQGLAAPIDQHADATYVNAYSPVWTGSFGASTGNAASTCTGWSSSTGNGGTSSIQAGPGWPYDGTHPCSQALSVYCFEN